MPASRATSLRPTPSGWAATARSSQMVRRTSPASPDAIEFLRIPRAIVGGNYSAAILAGSAFTGMPDEPAGRPAPRSPTSRLR
ncbi:hypothetical protein GCM10007977_075990 [Dactylosporangium sucinum]|uniref:Uncharacterized protein n=1 Tax=Dactylosporangium sucinum TaxID=1424081 RepID=A0A917U8S2_9ACTN|nr:hypothetical protein GCM10007977_075990 [Dactylosporangium sucinum]